MPRLLSIFAVFMLAAGLGACSQSAPQSAAANPPFYVPATLIVQTADTQPSQPSMLAFQVLPAANIDDFFYPRDEKFVYGATTVSEVSSYSVLVYDAQRITARRDGGYRYTWEVRQGIEFP